MDRTPSRNRYKAKQRYSVISATATAELPCYRSHRTSLCLPSYVDEASQDSDALENVDSCKFPPTSNQSTPVKLRHRSVSEQDSCSSDHGRFIEPLEADEDEELDSFDSDLDILLSQTTLLLQTSGECLGGVIEARESLKRFNTLDALLERTIIEQETQLRKRAASTSAIDQKALDLENEVNAYLNPSKHSEIPSTPSLPPCISRQHRRSSAQASLSLVTPALLRPSRIVSDTSEQRSVSSSTCDSSSFVTAQESVPPSPSTPHQNTPASSWYTSFFKASPVSPPQRKASDLLSALASPASSTPDLTTSPSAASSDLPNDRTVRLHHSSISFDQDQTVRIRSPEASERPSHRRQSSTLAKSEWERSRMDLQHASGDIRRVGSVKKEGKSSGVRIDARMKLMGFVK